LHNLALHRPDQVAALSAHYADWAARCGVLPWQDVRDRSPKFNPQRRGAAGLSRSDGNPRNAI